MHKVLDLKLPPDLLFLILLLIMKILETKLALYRFSSPFWLLILFFLLGLYMVLATIQDLQKNRTTVSPRHPADSRQLVTTGLYAVSRNPMYLGMALLLLSWWLYLGALSGLLGVLAFITYLTYFQIIPEEKALMRAFGQDYRDYCTETRRWL